MKIYFFQLLWSFWSFAILKEMTVPDQIWSIFLCPSGGLQVTIFFVDIVDMMSSQSAVFGSQILALPSISLLTDGKCLTSSVAEESIPHCSDRVSKLPGTSANIELVPFIIYTMFNFIFSLTVWLQISREIFIIFQHLCFLELLGQMSSFMRLFFIL